MARKWEFTSSETYPIHIFTIFQTICLPVAIMDPTSIIETLQEVTKNPASIDDQNKAKLFAACSQFVEATSPLERNVSCCSYNRAISMVV